VQSKWYEIRIQGTLGPDWAEWFEGMEIRQEGDGQTILAGSVVDQAALHGLLVKVRNLNLTLLSVNPALPAEPPATQHESQGE
jgi:hypothetical protein